MVRFSPANTKTKKLADNFELASQFLTGGRKVYSLDLLSGWSCPAAKDCLAKAVIQDGSRRIQDGPDTQFRCFSASQEVIYTGVYNLRKANFDEVKGKTRNEIFLSLANAMPKNAGIIRIHVAGDFFNQSYFDAWLAMAKTFDKVLFYAYTKNLPLWLNRMGEINELPNFVLTASYGGKFDSMIELYNLRYSKVVYSKGEACELGLVIDTDDSHAACPSMRDLSFGLLIHGVQPKKKLQKSKSVV